jgi:hypothetical protein
MRRIILFFFTAQLCSNFSIAQEANEKPLEALRSLYGSINLPHVGNVTLLCNWNDSIADRKLRWIIPYDSLMQDSLSLTSMEKEVVSMDAALVQFYKKPTASIFGIVKNQFAKSNLLRDQSDDYTKKLYAMVRELAVEYSDFELAYALQNKLHAFEYADWSDAERKLMARYDSLLSVSVQDESKALFELDASRKQTMQWHLLAMAGFVFAVILLSILIYLNKKWKKQRNSLALKANDTSEEEALVMKLEQAKREIVELKILAKKKVESEAVENELPTLPKGDLLTPSAVSQWNDEIQQALAKIKSHCESGKSSMGVATYMSIINDTTRLSSLVHQKSEEWVALLNQNKNV